MSYSYIKSVFPDFKPSKVYDENVYQFNVLPQNSAPSSGSSPEPAQDPSQVPFNQLGGGVDSGNGQTVEKFHNCDDYAASPLQSVPGHTKDNLRYYKEPVPVHNQTQPNTTSPVVASNAIGKETFDTESDCSKTTTHVLSCTKCQSMIRKSLGWSSQTEEIMELVSYIIFAVFIFLVIQKIKQN